MPNPPSPAPGARSYAEVRITIGHATPKRKWLAREVFWVVWSLVFGTLAWTSIVFLTMSEPLHATALVVHAAMLVHTLKDRARRLAAGYSTPTETSHERRSAEDGETIADYQAGP